MSIQLNSSYHLIDNKYTVVVNGIEYIIYWLLEYLDLIEI